MATPTVHNNSGRLEARLEYTPEHCINTIKTWPVLERPSSVVKLN